MKTLLHLIFCFICVGLSAQTQFGADLIGTQGSLTGLDLDITPDGKRIVYGAPGVANLTGLVKVYEESGSGWTQVGTDLLGLASSDAFGWSVAISDDGKRIAVGASWISTLSIYEESGGNWTKVGNDITGFSDFGNNIEISSDGKRVAASSQNFSGNTATKIYEESGGTWTQVGGDIPTYDGDISLSADGTRIAVSDNNGFVKVYDESGGTWTQVGSTLHGLVYAVSLSADGKRMVKGTGNGFVAFEESGGAWITMDSTTWLGRSVAISGDGNSIVSADLSQVIQQYEEISGAWTPVGTPLYGDPYGFNEIYAVGINHNGSRIILSDKGFYNEGVVQTFDTALSTSNTNIEKLDIGQLSVFPNPTTGQFELQLTDLERGAAEISITDMLGRVVWERELGEVEGDWSGQVELTDRGVYTVTVSVGSKKAQTRVVVQ